MPGLFNAAEFLLTRHVEAGLGERTAVLGTTSQTFGSLEALVGHVAAAYRSAGLRRDDRVMMVMDDDVPMLAAIVGAFRAGLVAVPVSTMLTSAELGTMMADCGPRLVICTQEFEAVVRTAVAAAPEVTAIVCVGPAGSGDVGGGPVRVVAWEDFVASGRAAPECSGLAHTDEDAWALWLYTSGTTGMPKAAMHRHANIRHTCDTYAAQVLGIGPEDRTLSVAKMFFAYGIGNSLFFPLSAGGTTVLEPRRPTPDVIKERMVATRPSLFFGVPTFYASLLRSDIPDDTFSSVRVAVSAGEPLPAPLLTRFKDRFGVDILDGIGSTEALHIFLSNRIGDIRPGTTGSAVPGYEVRIRDDDDRPVAQGAAGTLQVRGASIALGYWHRADASRHVFRGEWLVTGDTYVQDEDRYFTYLGRSGEMLKAGGIWVAPAEVEARLLEHPAVRQVAVVGLADENGLDKPVAVVVREDPDVTADELVAWCRDGLAHFKAPRRVVFVEELPTTATGKLQRFKVRALVGGEPTTSAEERPTSGVSS